MLTLKSDGFVNTATDHDKRICLVNKDYCKSPFSTTIVEAKDTKNAILFDMLPWPLIDGTTTEPKTQPADTTWGRHDTENIQKKVFNGPAPGETIEFPAGIYCIGNPGLSLKSDIMLTPSLDAEVTITQLMRFYSTYFFQDAGIGMKDVTFQGLKFDGNRREHNSTDNQLIVLNADGHSHFRLLDCEIRNFDYGIRVLGNNHSSFEFSRCKFSNMGGSAVGFFTQRQQV